MLTYAKALVAAATAFVGALTAGAADGQLTALDWLVAAGTALAALGGVGFTPNADRPAKPGP